MRLDHLLIEDLRVDVVLTLGQVRRRYVPEMALDELRAHLLRLASSGAITTWPAWIPLTARSRRPERVDLIALRHLNLPPATLRHLCGVAEMRWILKGRCMRWSTLALYLAGETEEPDAVAEDGAGPIAVEYDAGAYSHAQVLRKGRTFCEVYGRQVWGAPSRERVRWLRSLLPDVEVLPAPWY